MAIVQSPSTKIALLLLLSVGLNLASLWYFWHRHLSNLGLALWIGSLGTFGCALLLAGLRCKMGATPRPTPGGQRRPPLRLCTLHQKVASPEENSQPITGGNGTAGSPETPARDKGWGRLFRVLAVCGVLLVALFLRAHDLDSIPGGVYLDEADNGLVGLRLLEMEYSPFTELRDSNATLYFYLLGFGLKLLGTSAFALRVVAVGAGVLTVAVFFVLARRYFGWAAALAATFLLAVSRWHINFSRIAFEALLVPLFGALAVMFLLRGLQTRRYVDLTLAGLFFGLGFHTYIGFRVFPLILFSFALHLAISRHPSWRVVLPGVAIFLVGIWLTLAPLGVYVAKNPDAFVRRMTAASVMNDVERQKSYLPIWANLQKSMLMFNWEGDPRARHNLPKQPMLDFVSGALFVFGIAYSLYRFRDSQSFLLLAWLVLGLLPGVFSLADSNPHSLRTVGVVPAVFLLTGVFWEEALAGVARLGSWRRGALALLTVPLLAASGAAAYLNYDTLFNRQYQSRSVWDDFDPVENAAGRYTKLAAKERQVFVSAGLTNHSAVRFHALGMPYQTLDLGRHFPVRELVDKDIVYALEIQHAYLLPELRRYYPGVQTEEKDKFGRTLFFTYTVKRDDANGIHGVSGKYYRLPGEGGEADKELAVERRDAGIGLDAGAISLQAPFLVEWQASLLVQRYGSYTFVMESTDGARLFIDEKPVLETNNSRAWRALLLPAGFHALRVSYQRNSSEGSLKLSWIPPGGREDPIPPAALYTLPLAKYGLLGKYFRGNNWSGQPALVQIDPFIAPNDLLPAPFSIEWEGRISVPTTGQYAFGTSSDDGSLLYVDEVLVVDNGGHHGDRYVEGRVTLSQGTHKLRLRYFQDDGGRKMELWWTPPGGRKEIVPMENLFPPDE
ncbi:MAG: glycosyltransferase family 39 protein [Chloroflexi bacterium]|nr:glycosyltransferase family 39 protein [Chloroflexota bacterium]